MYVPMYVCMYERVCVYVCMHACMHACVCVCIGACVCVCMSVCERSRVSRFRQLGSADISRRESYTLLEIAGTKDFKQIM